MSASPFGLGASMAPEDLARLFGRMPIGAPQGFAPVAESEADVQRLERATGMVPQPTAPAPRAGLVDVSPAPRPGAMTVPLPPARPAELSTSEADLPAAGAQPIMAAPGAPAAPASPPAAPEGPSFGDRLMKGLKDNGDYLGALGAGLLSSPTWAGGISAGIQLASNGEKDRAVTDLAKVELGLKQRKLAQETAALGGNAAIIKKAFPSLSDAEATAAGSNTGIVTDALKRLQDPNYGRENDPAFIRQKAQAQAEGTAAGKPDESYVQLPEQERIALGLPAGAYQRDTRGKISAVNPTGTTINMGAEKAQDATVGKGYGEYQLDLATKGRNAGSTLNTLALMEQAMNSPGFYSGVGGESMKRANQFLGALGVKDSRAASAAEVFDALSNKVVLDGLGGSLGPGISNTDRDYIARTAPTLAQSVQGNRDLIGVARSLAKRQQQVSQLARDYAAKNNGRLDAGFDQALDEFAANNPLFPQARAGASASAPKEPPQGAPTGARQAPDGMWYVPDPNRPGKYLKVQ